MARSGEGVVSIGVPVYNGAAFLREALESLLRQTYTNLQIVISDNASTDDTGAICREYAVADSRVHYHRNAANIGLTANFRRTLDLSSGDYFMWACADDIRPPDAVERCVAALEGNPRAVMAHGPVLVKVGQNPALLRVANEVATDDARASRRVRALTDRLKHNGMTYGVYRRARLTTAVFGDHWGQDYLLCLQMSMLGSIVYVPVPIIVYRMRTLGSASTPMGADAPVTLRGLSMRNRPKFKAWVVLFLGVHYLLRLSNIPYGERLSGVVAHVTSFAHRYKGRLGRDLVRIIVSPLTEVYERLLPVRRFLKMNRM